MRKGYRPYPNVTDLLCHFLDIVVTVTLSVWGEVCVRKVEAGPGETIELTAVYGGGECNAAASIPINECLPCLQFFRDKVTAPIVAEDLVGGRSCARWTSESGSSMSTPLLYQGSAVGVLALAAPDARHYSPSDVSVCQFISREIAYHVKRYESHWLTRELFGKDLLLVGISDALRSVDQFIERASQVSLPVLIIGEFGCEKRHVAYALHARSRADYPLVEVSCAALNGATLKETINAHFSHAVGGTMFFDGIDSLNYSDQMALSEALDQFLNAPPHSLRSGGDVKVRLVASASRNIDHPGPERKFCEPLLEKFNYLLLHIAPLRERKEDIAPLADHFLQKHSKRSRRVLSAEVVEAFEAHDWPRNAYDLERIVARLAVMSPQSPITLEDLHHYAPGIAAGPMRSSRVTSPSHEQTAERSAGGEPARQTVDPRVGRLARNLIKQDFGEVKRFHPGLKSAIEYLAHNLHQAITLQELARHACLSASHLSYLFQKTLGLSFKSFLAVLRIEEAKQLLADRPHMRITEISLEVGFSDLRHFERTFKRLVGLQPREYRGQLPGAAEEGSVS